MKKNLKNGQISLSTYLVTIGGISLKSDRVHSENTADMPLQQEVVLRQLSTHDDDGQFEVRLIDNYKFKIKL